MASGAGDLGRRRHWSTLTRRILAVNVLALAILVAGVLYLARYQERLIQAELDAMTIEARIFAGALAEGALIQDDDRDALSPDRARRMVRRLGEATETRTRLFDIEGALIADSRIIGGPKGKIQFEILPPPSSRSGWMRWLDDVYEEIANRFPGRGHLPEYRELPEQRAGDYPDVARALDGTDSDTVWWNGEHGLLLSVAVPVQRFKQVLGAVLLTRSGAHIDRAIRSVRGDILRVFLVCLAITVLLSLYLAGTIARPMRKLALAADRVRRGHGRHQIIPDFTHRGDEIGELSGALRDMTQALWARMDAIERFAADVSHEIKNPLSSLRSAVETVARVNDPERRAKLIAIIEDDVNRLDRLISDIAAASRLDAELSRAETRPVNLSAMLATLADLHDCTAGPEAPRLAVGIEAGATLVVPGFEDRLVQVFQNLIANALSFSPPAGVVTLSANAAEDVAIVRVSDQGPGIPDGKEEAIFERFYSERPSGEKFGTHSGLGLSISRQIIDAHGGRIEAHNRFDEKGRVIGAEFTVFLPRG